MEQNIVIKTDYLQLITVEQAWHYRIVPREALNGSIFLYTDNIYTENIKDEIELIFNKEVFFEVVDSEIIQRTLGKYYRKQQLKDKEREHVDFNTSDEDFLVKLIKEAKQAGSSDIHIETYEDRNRVRMRIDGMLIERYIINKTDYPALINQIKIKANLDISEKRLPQDGRIYFENRNEKFDIRVSVLPTLYGEKVVLRLLMNDASNIEISKVGFEQSDLENYLDGVRKPHGIVLVSGPTGSGKTTTLYATLKLLNKETRNVLTVEDPIEYTLDGINQVQVKDSIGFSFAKALRTFLRQDPDVIMVGEIRDAETASIAIRAALTGHLVLSTIHTNSAWGSISRLLDMDIPPFLLASTLNTTVAQRLVRLLCSHCKMEEDFDNSLFPKNYVPVASIKKHCRPVGCDDCHYTGYKGRKAIFEVIPIDFELTNSIKKSETSVDEYLKQKNINTLKTNAFELFYNKNTSIEEVYPILANQ